MLGAVEVGTEAHAVIRDFAQFGKTKDLVAARIGKDRSVPGHEFVQPTEIANQFMAGPKIKMIRIAQNDLRAEFFERFVTQTLHCPLRTHRHEEGCIDCTVWSVQAAAPCSSRIGFRNFEREIHSFSVSGENPGNAHLARNVDCPNRNCNAQRLPFQFFRIDGYEANGNQQEHPDAENVDRFCQRHQYLWSVVRQKCAKICGNGIFKVDGAWWFQIQNQDEEKRTEIVTRNACETIPMATLNFAFAPPTTL